MTAKMPVLVVGATGMVGYEVAQSLAHRDELQVKALVRFDANPHRQEKLQRLQSLGVELVEGTLSDGDALQRACAQVETVVSCVRGDRATVIDGQIALIQAAQAAGVKRLIPSDYSVDYRRLDWGDTDNLDMRKAVLLELERSGLDYTLILNGILTEVLFSPFSVVFNFQRGKFNYWGDGETLFDTTTLRDVADYTTAAVLDSDLSNQALQVAGDTLSMKHLRSLYETNTIQVLKERCRGSVADLQTLIAERKATAKSPADYSAYQYHYALVSGKGKLQHIQNERYPHIQPQSVQSYIREHYKTEVLR